MLWQIVLSTLLAHFGFIFRRIRSHDYRFICSLENSDRARSLSRAQDQTMEGAFFKSIRAGRAIDLVNQRGARTSHEDIGRVVFQFDADTADEPALRQITKQGPEIYKSRVEILVDDARFRFRVHGAQFKD